MKKSKILMLFASMALPLAACGGGTTAADPAVPTLMGDYMSTVTIHSVGLGGAAYANPGYMPTDALLVWDQVYDMHEDRGDEWTTYLRKSLKILDPGTGDVAANLAIGDEDCVAEFHMEMQVVADHDPVDIFQISEDTIVTDSCWGLEVGRNYVYPLPLFHTRVADAPTLWTSHYNVMNEPTVAGCSSAEYDCTYECEDGTSICAALFYYNG